MAAIVKSICFDAAGAAYSIYNLVVLNKNDGYKFKEIKLDIKDDPVPVLDFKKHMKLWIVFKDEVSGYLKIREMHLGSMKYGEI